MNISALTNYLICGGLWWLVVAIGLKVLLNNNKTVKVLLSTSKRDFNFIYAVIIKGFTSWTLKLLRNETIFKSLDKNCKTVKSGSRTCFLYKDEKWTFAQVQRMSFQVANYFQKLGYKKGDVVGLAMHNRPEIICIWLGLSRLGVITSLINYNIVGDSLEHCLQASKCQSVIFGTELRETFLDFWESRKQEGGKSLLESMVLYELGRFCDNASSDSNPQKHNLLSISKDTSSKT